MVEEGAALHRMHEQGHRHDDAHRLGLVQEKSEAKAKAKQKSGDWDKTVRWIPTFVPYIGIKNVTEPTIAPPPTAKLKDHLDIQPLDTKLGSYILGKFGAGPTGRPPPTQDALDNIFASCPDLEIPGSFKVLADPNCGQQRGNKWTTMPGDEILSYSETCDPTADGDMYMTLPWGDLMGYTRTMTPYDDPEIDRIEVFDCGDNHIYTIDEIVSKKTVGGDQVYIKWTLTTSAGSPIGHTDQVPLWGGDFVL